MQYFPTPPLSAHDTRLHNCGNIYTLDLPASTKCEPDGVSLMYHNREAGLMTTTKSPAAMTRPSLRRKVP